MNSQRPVSASKNNNTQRRAQSLGVTLDHHVDFYALGAFWMRCTLCIVIFGRTHCMQTVHLIIFCPINSVWSLYHTTLLLAALPLWWWNFCIQLYAKISPSGRQSSEQQGSMNAALTLYHFENEHDIVTRLYMHACILIAPFILPHTPMCIFLRFENNVFQL